MGFSCLLFLDVLQSAVDLRLGSLWLWLAERLKSSTVPTLPCVSLVSLCLCLPQRKMSISSVYFCTRSCLLLSVRSGLLGDIWKIACSYWTLQLGYIFKWGKKKLLTLPHLDPFMLYIKHGWKHIKATHSELAWNIMQLCRAMSSWYFYDYWRAKCALYSENMELGGTSFHHH